MSTFLLCTIVYWTLDVLGNECDLIQSEVYKNSRFIGTRNDKVLYYDCTNYYFEIEQEDGNKKYGKSKKQRKNPNDPGRFIGTIAVTDDGEIAKPHSFLDEDKITDEARYDGLYAVCTELQDENRIKAHFLICSL